jgi:hypothetical protein
MALFLRRDGLMAQPHHVKAAKIHGKRDDNAGLEHAKKTGTESAEAHDATATAHGASAAVSANV